MSVRGNYIVKFSLGFAKKAGYQVWTPCLGLVGVSSYFLSPFPSDVPLLLDGASLSSVPLD
jgi:hypothetical protein